MVQNIHFVKYSGAGNDFVVIDNMGGSLQGSQADIARALCSRPFGIGADGLLVIERSAKADFTMRYYNADGSYGGMCGNGGRCSALFAHRSGHAGDRTRFEALDHIYEAEIRGENVRLRMKDPRDYRPEVPLAVNGQNLLCQFINTGSPHVALLVDDLERTDVHGLGRAIRRHHAFAPEGTNVNFLHIDDGSSISIRTYERGVEAETLACGTGSVASALISVLLGKCKPPVAVHVRSGETLQVDFRQSHPLPTDVTLQGSAHPLFEGTILYDTDTATIRPPASAQ